MSAIYGYTILHEAGKDYAGALQSQNTRYGGDIEDLKFPEKGSAIGSCIRDLSGKGRKEPAVITFNQYTAVFDVLLYNRDEIETHLDLSDTDLRCYLKNNRKELSELTDGELLFFYLLKFGYSALKEVNGDFAGAVYNAEEKNWTLMRDHSGIRPLFYYLGTEKFIFSTDLRGIIAFPEIHLSVNEENLYNLMMGYNELTLCETDYTEIHCIRPAAWTVIDSHFQKSEHIYWQFGSGKIRYEKPERYAKELRNLVEDSIRRRLEAVSGVVGCELSGGLDSSVIAILIHRMHRDASYVSWSDSPEDTPLREGEDERKVIFDICQSEGITCSFLEGKKNRKAETILQRLERPDVPNLNTIYLGKGSEKVRKDGACVMFTGHGGDEGVSHRGNFYELWYQNQKVSFFKAIWNSTSVKDKRILRFIYRVMRQFFIIHPRLKAAYRNGHYMEYFLTDSFKEKMKKTQHLPLTFAYDPVAYTYQGGPRVRIENAAVQGAEKGIQYLFPYLDYRVLDYAFSIPRFCFQNGFTNRAVFREAFSDLMPESLRKVHYKDEASRRNLVHSQEEIREASEAVADTEKELLTFLDRKLWGEYLDFDKLEKLAAHRNTSEAEINSSTCIIEELFRCARTQNLMEKLAADSEQC